MSRFLFFAFLFGIVFVGAADAAAPSTNNFPETHNYPAYQRAAQTINNYDSSDTNQTGGVYAAGSLQGSTINVATTKYVNTKTGEVGSSINTLASAAATDNSSVTSNGTVIGAKASGGQAATGMFLNRIDTPSGSGNLCPRVCGSNGTTQCKCGYISADGTNGTRQWVMIQE